MPHDFSHCRLRSIKNFTQEFTPFIYWFGRITKYNFFWMKFTSSNNSEQINILLSAENSTLFAKTLYFPTSEWIDRSLGAGNFSIVFLDVETSCECSLIHSKLSLGVWIRYLNDEIQHISLWQAKSLKSLHLTKHVGVGFGKWGICVYLLEGWWEACMWMCTLAVGGNMCECRLNKRQLMQIA